MSTWPGPTPPDEDVALLRRAGRGDRVVGPFRLPVLVALACVAWVGLAAAPAVVVRPGVAAAPAVVVRPGVAWVPLVGYLAVVLLTRTSDGPWARGLAWPLQVSPRVVGVAAVLLFTVGLVLHRRYGARPADELITQSTITEWSPKQGLSAHNPASVTTE